MVADAAQILKPFLDRLRLRSPLSKEEIEAAGALPVSLLKAKTNSDFVRPGERLDHACLVVEGLVGRLEQTASGARQITALHIPGDMADLHSVVLPKTSWALQALTSSTIARVPHSALVETADRFPALARAFWRDCTVDASIIANWAVSLGRRNAKSRFAHLLCELRCRYNAIGRVRDRSFELPMTQSHMGDVLGLTPIHVNRMARELREDGLANVASRGVEVLNWDRLQAVADFDPAYLHLERQTEPAGGR
jgi:CRP-like cAMP-binding protein